MSSSADLVQLAQKILSEGPFRQSSTPRRVRGLFNGKFVFDTVNAVHVWEHPYYPQYYVPIASFTPSASLERTAPIDGSNENGTAHLGRLAVGDRSTDRIVIFNTGTLHELVKIDFNAIDQWFEEDVRIYTHPKDPFKRIDILNSSRRIKVTLEGVTLADCSNPLFLLETSLRPRYYLSPTSVMWEYLTKSETETYCPYKGKANYYNVNIKGKVYKDLVWYYTYPTAESVTIAGHLCFYNEKVDIYVAGVQEQR
ncbi:DUF427-domain-containing protein [Aaosphaeria arxii CBS 175.79]|uniref:DUF427-domain-containing protein n=1 Tax=Aaosphaeria arxii CBS 175.79 TaxID=1450172 RepID=A0A6A5XPZ7_9PLEO|nr:DUF427-domain-containing protein [Aaosphaeria arxii CBS 175.79]KAF2014831.1 DUF427-domain-containing protein [Aaosphaeria arxii CBS 175.79]